MKSRISLAAFAVAIALLFAAAQAQVASAEVQGVETTSAPSMHVQAWQQDGSVGEVRVVVVAYDDEGNPVSGAPVTWRVDNLGSDLVYVVGASTDLAEVPLTAYTAMDLTIDGGTTNADGEAYLIVDSMTSGDARVFVTVGGVEGKTYRGRDMRVVWF